MRCLGRIRRINFSLEESGLWGVDVFLYLGAQVVVSCGGEHEEMLVWIVRVAVFLYLGAQIVVGWDSDHEEMLVWDCGGWTCLCIWVLNSWLVVEVSMKRCKGF